MTRICRRMLRFNAKRAILWRVAVFRQCVGSFWNRVLACWIGKSVRYRQLQPPAISASLSSISVPSAYPARESAASGCSELDKDPSDLVALKISLLGDCQIGKTSFLVSAITPHTPMYQVFLVICFVGNQTKPYCFSFV